MRLAPLLAGLLLILWLFLSALAWALAGSASDRGPRLAVLTFVLPAGVLGALLPALFGQRGGLGLLLSFPLAFLSSLVACAIFNRLPTPRAGPQID